MDHTHGGTKVGADERERDNDNDTETSNKGNYDETTESNTKERKEHEHKPEQSKQKLRQTYLKTYDYDRMNETWGDILTMKETNKCRMVLQNVNGLRCLSDCDKTPNIAREADAYEADIIGLVETNTDWKYGTTKEMTYKHWNRYYDHIKISTSSSNLSFGSIYQPGGTMTIVASPYAGRATTFQDESGLGRWTETEIIGKDNRTVCIFNVYAVGKNKIGTCGPMTSYFQQWMLLNKDSNTRVDPRDKLFQDLGQTIQERQTARKEVIIMIDANDSLQNPNSKFTKWVHDMNLIDVHCNLHGTDDEPATYSRGTTRIDYFLATERINEYITEAGILPLHEFAVSDHRALFIDIDLKAYLGGELYDALHRNTRQISTSDPRTVVKYQEELEKELDNSGIEEMVQRARSMEKENKTDNEFLQLIEHIDKKFTEIKLKCERKSAQRFRHPWSPTLNAANRRHSFWSIWLSEVQLNTKAKHNRKEKSINDRKRVNFMRQREKYADDTNKEFIHKCTKPIINANLKKVKAELRRLREEAAKRRDEFLTLQVETYNKQGEKHKAKGVASLQKREHKRKMFRKLTRLMGKVKSGGLDHILQTTSEGTKRISDRDEMYMKLIERNIAHFSQSDGTPMTEEPMRTLLGSTATNSFCNDILNGTIDLQGLSINEATKAILNNLKKPKDHGNIDIDITGDDVMNGYKKWNENTSTSPSGCHLGHEKAILKCIDKQEEKVSDTGKEPLYRRIFNVIAQKMNWSIQHCYVYDRWKKVVNAMIEKIPGKPLLTKLRIIHLLESDFNLMIGILWGRRLVYHGEANNYFDDGQSGSRPTKRCQELLTQKDTMLSIWRMSKARGAFFDNDAKSCFDRIVMTVASLCSQQLGMPPAPCATFLTALSQMIYHIKTSFGVSNEHYSSTTDYTIHGPGQGGRGSPCVWLIISSLLMKCARMRTEGAKVINPFNKDDAAELFITGFVDDVTHWISNEQKDSIELIADVQRIAQWWEQLLNATGGKLALEKCFVYVMDWKFDINGNGRIIPPIDIPVKVQLTDSETKEEYNIDYRSCDEYHRSLGVYYTPSGSNKEEFKRLLSKSRSYAQRVAGVKTTRDEAKLLYFSYYLPSMQFSLCVGGCNFNQCQKIQGVTTQKFLSKMGFNRCTPSAVTYANKSCGGIGIPHLFAEQGTEKILHIMQTIRTGNITGKLLLQRLNWAHRIAGTSKPILEDTETIIPQLNDELWIRSMREFLEASELFLKIPLLTTIPLQCRHDKFLMETAAQYMTEGDIIRANNCRLFLRVTTLADLATADGKYIRKELYDCETVNPSSDEKEWPYQERPGKTAIKAWQSLLDIYTAVDSLKLEQPLGEWIYDREMRVKSTTNLFYHLGRNSIMKITEDGWQENLGYKVRKGIELGDWTQLHSTIDSHKLVPAGPIQTNNTGKNIITWRNRVNTYEAAPNPRLPSWREHINSQEGYIQQILSESEINFFTTLQLMQNKERTIVVYTNHRILDDKGYYAWIAEYNGQRIGKGNGQVPGHRITPHRAELFAILAWTILMEHITTHGNVRNMQHRTIVHTTSKAIVKELNKEFDVHTMRNALTADYDIINEQHRLMKRQRENEGTRMEYRRIKHKKKKTSESKSHIELQSEASAELARNYATRNNQQQKGDDFQMDSCEIYLSSKGTTYYSREKEIARWKWADFQIQDYYCDKFDLTIKELHTIDWYNLKRARDKLPTSLQTFSIKYNIDWLATGSRMELQGDLVTTCIHCGLYEDSDHLFRCLKRKEKIQDLLDRFTDTLEENKTDPRITRTLKYYMAKHINCAHKMREPKIKVLEAAVKEQEVIGWHRFARGIWSNKWNEVQREYETRNKIMDNKWARNNIIWLIETGYEKWNERNQAIHSQENTTTTRAHDEAMAQVSALYEKENETRMADRDIFEMDISTRLQQSTKALQTWYRNIREKVTMSIRTQTAYLLAQQPKISAWASLHNTITQAPPTATDTQRQAPKSLTTTRNQDNTTENKKNDHNGKMGRVNQTHHTDHEGDKENTLHTKAHGTTSYGTETATTVKTTEKTTPLHVNKCTGTRDPATTSNELIYSTSGPLSSVDRNGRTLN